MRRHLLHSKYTSFDSFTRDVICLIPNIRHLIVNDNVRHLLHSKQIVSVDMASPQQPANASPNQSPSRWLNIPRDDEPNRDAEPNRANEPNRVDEPEPAQLPRDEAEVF
jgi:hypothetical protein